MSPPLCWLYHPLSAMHACSKQSPPQSIQALLGSDSLYELVRMPMSAVHRYFSLLRVYPTHTCWPQMGWDSTWRGNNWSIPLKELQSPSSNLYLGLCRLKGLVHSDPHGTVQGSCLGLETPVAVPSTAEPRGLGILFGATSSLSVYSWSETLRGRKTFFSRPNRGRFSGGELGFPLESVGIKSISTSTWRLVPLLCK